MNTASENGVSSHDGCTVTLLTPASRGAVATIAVEGPAALILVARLFRPLNTRLELQYPIGKILVGHWQSTGSAEEVVVCRRSDRCLEVNCHGGQAASDAIIDSLIAAGAQRATPESWLAARDLDPIQRAAWLALRDATTSRTAAILLDQFRGALSRSLTEIMQAISESAHDTCPRRIFAEQQLTKLIALADLGLHLTNPWRIVFAGPPNVGKSSLVNAILGYERAIVFDQPGTTRDVLTATTALDGWPMELIDTAGLRESVDEIEAQGVLRARGQIETADIVVFVTDNSWTRDNRPDRTFPAKQVLIVANKADLLSGTELIAADSIQTSAVTGSGLDVLMRAIVERLVPTTPQPGDSIPFTLDHVACLCRMLDAVQAKLPSTALQFGEMLLGSGSL